MVAASVAMEVAKVALRMLARMVPAREAAGDALGTAKNAPLARMHTGKSVRRVALVATKEVMWVATMHTRKSVAREEQVVLALKTLVPPRRVAPGMPAKIVSRTVAAMALVEGQSLAQPWVTVRTNMKRPIPSRVAEMELSVEVLLATLAPS